MTLAEALRGVRRRLEHAGIESAEAESWLLLESLLEQTRADLLLRRGEALSRAQEERLEIWLERRESREPLQHILAVAPFYGLTLRVTKDTLIPRPETERLVELALHALQGKSSPRVLEVGSGSGAIALALKAERPDVVVLATDLSSSALAVAAENAETLELSVRFLEADLLDDPVVQAFAREADLLLANLPYLPEGDRGQLSPEVQRDPPEALFSGADGLAHFRRLGAQAHGLLRPGAVALFELDPRNVRQAQRESAHWAEATVHRDLVGRERFLELVR